MLAKIRSEGKVYRESTLWFGVKYCGDAEGVCHSCLGFFRGAGKLAIWPRKANKLISYFI